MSPRELRDYFQRQMLAASKQVTEELTRDNFVGATFAEDTMDYMAEQYRKYSNLVKDEP